jgi:hypothetical protein
MHERLSVVLIEALTRVWSRIRVHHPGVPGVMLLAAPSQRGDLSVLGHFAPLRWRHKTRGDTGYHEVVVVAEHLDRSAADIVETLIHEAAHALNFERKVHDCSRSQYHNRAFKAAAEELGLAVEQVPHYGFALTRLQRGHPAALRRRHQTARRSPHPPRQADTRTRCFNTERRRRRTPGRQTRLTQPQSRLQMFVHYPRGQVHARTNHHPL